MNEPTPEHVLAFVDHMRGHFLAQIADKRDAVIMRAASVLLDQLGIVEKTRFLENFATTIGRTIYLPFEPGVPSAGWPLWTQMVVLTHECQHIAQLDRLGAWAFFLRYVTKKAERAVLEADAYRCQLELYFWRTGQVLAPKLLAARLQAYAVTATDIRVAEKVLVSSAETIKRGGVMTEAGRVAIAWLDKYAPDLRDAR